MAKKAGSAAALPIMQAEVEAGNAIEETELQPENPEAPVVVEGQETAPATPTNEPAPKPAKGPIPFERFEEVNSKRIAAEKEATELREKWARLDAVRQHSQEIEQRARQTADAARLQAQRPDPDLDPKGAQIWDLEQKLNQVTTQLPQLQQNFQQTEQQIRIDREQAQLNQWEMNDVARVTAQHPDYPHALQHLYNVRIGHYTAMGNTPEQAQALWNLEKAAYVRQCAQNNVSIADFAYKMAGTVGYQPPQTATNGNGATNGQARIQQLQNGQKVQGLGGKVPAAETDQHANIGSMTAAQFDEWMNARWNVNGKFNEEQMISELNSNPALRKAVNDKFANLG